MDPVGPEAYAIRGWGGVFFKKENLKVKISHEFLGLARARVSEGPALSLLEGLSGGEGPLPSPGMRTLVGRNRNTHSKWG